MIEQLSISGFKPFSPRGKLIGLRSVNILIGTNSVGKSSFLQSLLVLKQSWRRHEDLPLRLRTSGGLVELGSLKNVVHKHRPGHILIGASVASRRIEFLYDATLIDQVDPEAHDSAELIQIRFQDRRLPDSLQPQLGRGDVCVVASIRPAEENVSVQEDGPVELDFRVVESNVDLSAVEWDKVEVLGRAILRMGEWSFVIPDAAKDTQVESQTPSFAGTAAHDESPREEGHFDHTESALTGQSDLQKFFENCYLRDLSVLREHIQYLRYIGPLRARGSRFYDAAQKSRDFVDASGRNFAHLAYTRRLYPAVNAALRALTDAVGRPAYTMQIATVGNTGKMLEVLFEQTVTSLSTSEPETISVGLPDLGCGLSQILPFLVQLADAISQAMKAAEDENVRQCIIIEQPELHLHPAMQKELANLIVTQLNDVLLRTTGKRPEARSSAPLEYANATVEMRRRYRNALPQIIVETHSPYLAEQFRDCVQEGSLHPDLLRFLSFTQSAMEVQIGEIDVDADGDFTSLWPDGYFDT